MSKIAYLVFFVFTCAAFAQDFATSTHFVPIPLHPDAPSRVAVGFDFAPTPSFELEAGYIYQLGAGFDIGAGLHGGVMGLKNYGILGLDVMFRFLKPLDETVFIGLQGQVGYVYTGIGNVSIALNAGSALPVTAGFVLGGVVRELSRFYFFPAVEFGQTMNAGDPLWKSGIGLRFTVGSAISLSDTTYLVIETRPRITNFVGSLSALNTFTIDATLGLLFDF